ncbi:hypothetical protein [Campylobacter concisus]|uniref:Uncharacterized protein n=1 Tax=Campylobacter concisus TaxID=199 RepID=A0A1Y5MLY3_9BACT|nr:hypothetical protein [Campylobacter concisus]OUT06715.1 hypothetical protein B9N65_10615 [Campylobacter concisus]
MLSNESLTLVKSVYAELTSGDFESFKELITDNKNQYFRDGANLCKALLIESERGSLELNYLKHEVKTDTQGFYAPCYIISNSGELFNLKQKAGYEPVISKIKDSLKADFCKAANLDEKLIGLLTNTKPVPRLEWVEVSKGYDLDDLPHSCQSGKGYRFRSLDSMAKLALLKIGSRIAARAIIWDSNVIFDETKGEYLNNRYADRLYYGDSSDRDEFIKALEAEGINLLWGVTNSRLKPETGDYSIQIDDTSAISWLDTFSLEKEGRLYSYDWVNGGYSDDTLNELASNEGFTRAFLSVDEEGGRDLEDVSNKVYSEYLGEYIDRENAVYSNSQGDWLIEDDAVWSSFQDDYIVSDYAYYSSIEDDYIDENTYEHSSQVADVVGQNGEWVRTDNKDYVPYKGDEYRRIALEDAVYIESMDEYVKADEAYYIDEIDENVRSDWDKDELKDYLANSLSSYSKQEIIELVEKYGF